MQIFAKKGKYKVELVDANGELYLLETIPEGYMGAGERHAIAQTQGKMNEVIVFMQIYSKDNPEYIDFKKEVINRFISKVLKNK